MAEGRYFKFICPLALAAVAFGASDDGKSDAKAPAAEKTTTAPARPSVPPVLRKTEPDDNHFVLLPGPPVPKAAPKPVPVPVKAFAPPAPASAWAPEVAASLGPPPPELTDPGRPVLRRAPLPLYPSDFEQDSGLFCQKQIGQWKPEDALALLGAPSADRPAYDDQQKVNGRIFAFTDPTNHYKQMELDFDGETGALRTVFVYPWKMTWQECRRLWGANVSAAEAAKGRKFYSYLNRRLDVLVDASGKVISIGLY